MKRIPTSFIFFATLFLASGIYTLFCFLLFSGNPYIRAEPYFSTLAISLVVLAKPLLYFSGATLVGLLILQLARWSIPQPLKWTVRILGALFCLVYLVLVVSSFVQDSQPAIYPAFLFLILHPQSFIPIGAVFSLGLGKA